MNATYSPEDDKLRLYCGRVDEGTYKRLRDVGFQRAYKQECFYAVWAPVREDLILELLEGGEIEDEDSTLVERAEVRAERFEGYSEKRSAEADRAHEAVGQIAQRFEGGQPILVGHHSERKARKDAERIENGMRKALKLWDTSKYWQSRAAGALAHAKYLERPTVRARRIKGLESDIRVYRSKFTPQGAPIMQQRWNARGDAPKIPHVFCAPRGGRGGSYVPVEDLPAIERHYTRWIQHAENRLVYERAMLGEQGATHLLDKKPKSAAAQLPLCNYRAPEGLQVENRYHRGEMMTLPQVEMTQAEYARINVDYKGTRVVGNSHRVRTAMQRGCLSCVFLTDFKTHIPPGPVAKEPIAEPVRWPVMQPAPEPTEQEMKFEALQQAVKAGVKAVSAPQLFPTPPELAARMVDMADIRPDMRVLEPSAGTGRIVEAIRASVACDLLAVEINQALASTLAHRFDGLRVREMDFLEMDANGHKFDRIVMNPPFAKGQDIAHVLHALKMLAPGGRLVAIVGGGPNQEKVLRKLAEERGEWEPLPAGTFSESGTEVNTVLLQIDQEPEPEIEVLQPIHSQPSQPSLF